MPDALENYHPVDPVDVRFVAPGYTPAMMTNTMDIAARHTSVHESLGRSEFHPPG